MKNFRLANSAVDPTISQQICRAVMKPIRYNPKLWERHTERQDHPMSPHRDTRCIYLRGPAEMTVESVFGLSVKDYQFEQQALPDILPLSKYLLEFLTLRSFAESIGRVMIVGLKPGGRIVPHRDEGLYAETYSRAHFCLYALPGNLFYCGFDCVAMLPGELWWFNHRQTHSVVNNSDNERIHLILDYKP